MLSFVFLDSVSSLKAMSIMSVREAPPPTPEPLSITCSGGSMISLVGLLRIFFTNFHINISLKWKQFGPDRSPFPIKQECIPVGCVPPVHWPYLPVYSGGVCSQGGVCSWRGVCSRGCPLPRGVYPSMHWGRHPPVNRILDTRLWKYYLAPKFVCGR